MKGFGAMFRAPVSERHVQAIWYDASLRPPILHTVGGEELHVVDPGTWNLESGPDFRHAVLELGRDRRRTEGDVEVHLRPLDWSRHRHGADSAYQGVVAHVTWYPGRLPPDLPLKCAAVCLGRESYFQNGFSLNKIDLAAYPYSKMPVVRRPCERFFSRDPDFGLAVLNEAGRCRLRRKANRLRARIAATGDPEQVFYEELLAAFGYTKNSDSFRVLAEELPLKDLPFTEEAALEAMSCVAGMKVPLRQPWRSANVRPGNSPRLRMADAAAIFTGARLSAAILANVIVPFALARGVIREPPAWLPPEGLNSVVRLAAFRLFGRDHNPALYSGNGILLQGLVQIHRDCCLAVHPECGSCRLVEWFEQDDKKGGSCGEGSATGEMLFGNGIGREGAYCRD